MEVIPTLAKDQHVHFLTDAHKRSELLLKIVQKEHAFDPVKGSRDTWLFVNPAFRCNDINGIPPWLRVQLIRRAHFFAYSWKKVIRNLVTDLRYIVTSCKYPLHDLNPAEQAKITRLKLHLGVPVAQYGCFMWAASNLKIMVSESVSELIRIAAAICNTPKSPEISSKSLRNHFDNPSPEAIRATIIDLQRIMQVLRDRLKSIEGRDGVMTSRSSRSSRYHVDIVLRRPVVSRFWKCLFYSCRAGYRTVSVGYSGCI